MTHRVTLIPGDGTGPEIMDVVRKVVDATGAQIDWEIAEAGSDVLSKYGTPLPEQVLQSIRKNKVAIKGPITTPIGTGFRSVNVALRKELDLYVCFRPCKSYAGVRSRFQNIDLIIVRENTEDLYAGIEWSSGAPEANQVIQLSGNKIRKDSAISIKPISKIGSARIARFAFDYALKNHRKKVTAVTKANIMKCTDGLFFDAAREVAKEYKGKIEYEERLIDNMCMQLVQKPELYDVMVLPNLYGDILSDLCAGLVGGLGVAPGANFGDEIALFEAIHGSAPKYTGLNKVNPSACLLSAKLMLDYLKEFEAAQKLEEAIQTVFAKGKDVTYDMKPFPNDPTAVGTREMGDAIIREMKVAVSAK
ncbi:MAG: isocitrate/isopropylmalate dehydrogenase family protein [Elusimicrobia bacterium]|nr:isocitrate/isopropylmalate dehydrogenase family protein [Elusimicrobiota bacterium]